LVELKTITQTSTSLLTDDIAELRKYHLLSLSTEVIRGGPTLVVPSGIRLMRSLIRDRIKDPNRIEQECARARAEAPTVGGEIGAVVHRTVALWKTGDSAEALEVALQSEKRFPTD